MKHITGAKTVIDLQETYDRLYFEVISQRELYTLQPTCDVHARSAKGKADNCENHKLSALRLASGSLITVIFSSCTSTTVSHLHLGQKSGKLISVVWGYTLVRVLLSHTGHSSNSLRNIVPPSRLIGIQIPVSHFQDLIRNRGNIC